MINPCIQTNPEAITCTASGYYSSLLSMKRLPEGALTIQDAINLPEHNSKGRKASCIRSDFIGLKINMKRLLRYKERLVRFNAFVAVWKHIGILRVIFDLQSYDSAQHFVVVTLRLK